LNQATDPAPARRRFVMNPVLAREIKERMRSPRATVILVVYLALLAGVLYLSYRLGLLTLRAQMFGGGGFIGNSMSAAALGRLMFEVLMIFLLGLIAFIAPGASTGAISGERERGTLQLLQITLLRPSSIVLGKLTASLGFLLLLLVASLPLFTVALILGGVTPGQAFRGLLVVTALAIFLAALGTYLSSIARRTLHATIGTYAVTFLLLFGTVLTYGAERIARSSGFLTGTDRPVSTYLNPFAALADAVGDPSAGGFIPSPLTMARQIIPSFIPGIGGFSEPPVVVASAEEGDVAWQLTARNEPQAGICVGLQANNFGSETCGMAQEKGQILLAQSPSGDGGSQIIFGAVSRDTRKLVVDLSEGRPIEVKPLTEEAEDAGFDDISFFVVTTTGDQRPTTLTALDKDDKEIASHPIHDMPVMPGGGMVDIGPPIPVPPGTPPPPDPRPLPAPGPAGAASDLPLMAPASFPVAQDSGPPQHPVTADIMPAPDVMAEIVTDPVLPEVKAEIVTDPVFPPEVKAELVVTDPVPPRAAVEAQGPGMFPVRDPSTPVWVVHCLILVSASVVLVAAGSYQLRRPRTEFKFRARSRT